MLKALSEPRAVVADNVHQASYHQKKQAACDLCILRTM